MGGATQIVACSNSLRAKPLEDVQFEPERAVAGIGDLGFDLAEFGGGESHLSGQRLPMDKGCIQRRGHQLVAVLRGDFDEITEHIVVPDLERLDAGVVGVARLHRCDHEPRGVAQVACLVQRRIIAGADKAAIALEQGQFVREAAREFLCESAGGAAQRVDGQRHVARQVVDPRQPLDDLVCRQNAVAQSRKTARPAASDRKPRQRARHVRRGAQDGAQVVAHGAVADEQRDRVEAVGNHRAVGERRGEALRQKARSGGRHRAVERVE